MGRDLSRKLCGSVQDFYNEVAYRECASRHIPAPFNAAVDIYNDGWETTLDLIRKQAADMAS